MSLKTSNLSAWGDRGITRTVVLCASIFIGIRSTSAQQLDDTCTVTVNGQTVQVNEDGSFVVPNVAAADLFGAGGPGTPPDFLSDDFLRLTGVCTGGAAPVYVTSECFRIRRGESLQVGNLTFGDVPPQFLASIRAAPGAPTLTTIGQQTPINLTGFFTDGSSAPLDPNLHCPATFRTSNAAVVTVSPDPGNSQRGIATARGTGTALITASVEGATSVTSITVSLGDPLTTVTGIVQTVDGDPVDGATVRFVVNGALIAGTGVTGPPGQTPGQFIVPGVATLLGSVSAYATATVDTVPRSGVSLFKTPVPGGFTDAGLITLDNRVFWVTNANGLWTTTTNWVSGALPSQNQIAVINVPAAVTVTLQQCPSCSTQIGGIECFEDFLFVNGGLNLSGPSVFHGAYVAGVTTGAFLNGAGPVTFNGPVTLNGSTLGNNTPSAPIMLNAGMTVAGASISQLFGRTVTNANNGTIAITGNGGLSRGFGAVLNNPLGSLIDIRTDADCTESGSPSGSTINNAGTFRKSGGTGLSAVGGAFNNTGVVEVQTGTLQFPGGTSSGSFAASPGATLEFSTTLQIPHHVSGSVTIPAGARLRIFAFLGAANLNGPTQILGDIITDNGAINFNALASTGINASSMSINGAGAGTGNLVFAGNVSTGGVTLGNQGLLAGAGTITVNGPFNWTGGNIGDATAAGTTLLNGGMTLSTTGGKTLTNRRLINANNGLAQWTGGFLSFGQGSVFENQPDATFDIRTDSNIGASDTLSRFDNAGTLRKSAGTGLSALVGIAFNNSGLVEAQTGTLQVGGGASSGDFTAAPGATLDFSPPGNSSQTITGDLTIPLGSTLRFGGNFATTNVDGPTAISGAVVASGGSVANFSAAASAGVAASSITASGATISFAGGASTAAVTQNTFGFSGGVIGGAGTLTVNGPYNWSDGTMGIGTSGGGATVLNSGMSISGTGAKSLVGRTLTNSNNGTIMLTGSGGLTLASGSVINNAIGSTFDIQADGVAVGTGGGPVSTFSNTGTLRKSGGTGTSTISNNLNNSGSVEVETGTLQFTGFFTFNQTAGSTLLAGGSITVGVGFAFQINGGTIGLGAGTASGTITGNVTLGNAAAVTVPRPGAAGTLTVTGTYAQTAGTLNIELGGTTPGTTFDVLAVGTAQLGGTLRLTLIDGFTPTVGQQFTILTATSRTGTFGSISLVDFPANLGVDVTYSTTAVTVTVINN